MPNNTLLKAKEFHNQARKEYKKAKEENSDVLFRDAAEKAWNATVLSTNYLINKLSEKDVKSNRQRRKFLIKLMQENGKFKKYDFYKQFTSIAYSLHINAFYEGIYTEEELEYNFKNVENYLKQVEKIV